MPKVGNRQIKKGLKISNEELEIVTGQKTPESAADFLLGRGISCVVITLGEKGAYAKTNKVSALVPA